MSVDTIKCFRAMDGVEQWNVAVAATAKGPGGPSALPECCPAQESSTCISMCSSKYYISI